MLESIKKEIIRELSSKVIEKKPKDDDELNDLVETVVEQKMKK